MLTTIISGVITIVVITVLLVAVLRQDMAHSCR